MVRLLAHAEVSSPNVSLVLDGPVGQLTNPEAVYWNRRPALVCTFLIVVECAIDIKVLRVQQEILETIFKWWGPKQVDQPAA